jgi:ureidoglycolate dehydrogenase (NAD+)
VSEADRPAPGPEGTVIPADALRRFATDVFVRAGLSPPHAGIVADVLVWADLRGVGTNPLSIAVAGGERGPVVLDMGMGVISMGALVQARKTGRPVPAGSALDGQGEPTTDARKAAIPLPLGGPKGSGLSLMIECLTSLVVGNPILTEALEGTPDGRRHKQNGLALAIDLARFGDPAAFRREVDRLVRVVKALPRAPDVPEILMPGERGRRTLERRRREGIPLPPAIVAELRGVADRLGVPWPPR